MRFLTDKSDCPPVFVSLLTAGSAREDDEEEEGENYEMSEFVGSHSRESLFGKGWRWTTTV